MIAIFFIFLKIKFIPKYIYKFYIITYKYLKLLIIANQKLLSQPIENFSFRTNWIAKTLNIYLSPYFYKNPPLYFVLFRAK